MLSSQLHRPFISHIWERYVPVDEVTADMMNPTCRTWQFALNLQDHNWGQTYRFSSRTVLQKASGQPTDQSRRGQRNLFIFKCRVGEGGTQSVFISAKMKLGEGHLLNNESKCNYLVSQCISALSNTLLHYSGFCAHSVRILGHAALLVSLC